MLNFRAREGRWHFSQLIGRSQTGSYSSFLSRTSKCIDQALLTLQLIGEGMIPTRREDSNLNISGCSAFSEFMATLMPHTKHSVANLKLTKWTPGIALAKLLKSKSKY